MESIANKILYPVKKVQVKVGDQLRNKIETKIFWSIWKEIRIDVKWREYYFLWNEVRIHAKCREKN